MKFFYSIYQSWTSFSKTKKGEKLIYWFKKLFLIGVLAYLVYQFWQIGWENVLKSLPTAPGFYLLYIPIFFLLPISELFIYRILWKTKFRDLWPVLLVKKVYNRDVIGYSGEVFLFNWASSFVGKRKMELLRDIKDNNVISSIVSTLMTLIVLLIFFKSDPGTFTRWFQKIPNSEIWYILISVIIIAALIYKFRKYLISQPLNTSLKISLIHFSRHCIGFILKVYQWHIALPKVPLYVWFTFMAIQLVMTRLPFLPNMDLIFLGLSIKVGQALGAPLASITAMMSINSIMGRTLNLSTYSYFQFLSPRSLKKRMNETIVKDPPISQELKENVYQD